MKINNVIPFFAASLLILVGCAQDEVIKRILLPAQKKKYPSPSHKAEPSPA